MDNIRNIIKILFRYTSPVEILEGNTHFDKVQEKSFLLLANFYMPQYSFNEVENMFHFFRTEFEWHNNKMWNRAASAGQREVNVFDALILFADNVLVEENGVPLCKYENLLRWREMVVPLDEDLFITAFLAQKDLLSMAQDRDFFWPPVIGHNSWALNRLLAQGVAENHFHLKGSAPLFHLSWISMMNDVCNPQFKQIFDSYDERRLHMKAVYQSRYVDTLFYVSYLQAALIRLYLFACLLDEAFTLRGNYIDYWRIQPFINKSAAGAVFPGSGKVDLDCYIMDFRSSQDFKALKKELMYEDVRYFLLHTDELQDNLPEIEKKIEMMQEKYAKGQLDYAICEGRLTNNPDRHLNEVISGERWLLYELFKRVYRMDEEFKRNLDWFYVYLLIKENIRAEMIQVNNNVGFHNFLLYQDRKESFIDTARSDKFEEVYLRMAVRDTILNQHIKKLEARITPKKTMEEMYRSIKKYDHFIMGEEDADGLRDRFFYVCHFIKEADRDIGKSFYEDRCRHYRKRQEIREQAEALLEFRRQAGDFAERLRGIDASSEEIGCRPEVFAQAFRFLKGMSVKQPDCIDGVARRLPDLCITYHVGEDFLDILDGLRAIDEAVSFLNMRCGDRLGHALALGVSVEDWYHSKSGYVLIPQMDYLDNLVWLYSKIRKFQLAGFEDTLRYIEKRYDEYFRSIYLNNMDSSEMERVAESAASYYAKQGASNHYGSDRYYFSINTYYDSWKLRGDNPEYFTNGYFKLEPSLGVEWNEYGINKAFPENYRIRYNPETAYLFYTYHYNQKVKEEGNRRKEIKVNPCIIKAAQEVQRRMQSVIAHKGIGIETNPSSNLLIGTFKRYDLHPILNWYNMGLVSDPEEASSCPQLQVSINTDDQGVFATYIENEYAYLALALEKQKDQKGKPKYNRTMIYQWLDNIRRMGLVQNFEDIGS